MFLTYYYVIQAVGPALAGVLRAHWDTAAAPLLFAAILMAAITALLGLFRVLARPQAFGKAVS